MKPAEILVSVSQLKKVILPVAREYLAREYLGKSKSKKTKQALLSAFNNNIKLKGFGEYSIDLRTFDWEMVRQDRNWWWQIQALPFLIWCIGAFELLDESEKQQALRFSLEALIQWIKKAQDNKDSPLVWHDHATAFRLRNIVCWFTFLLISDYDSQILDRESDRTIMHLVKRHVEFLCEDKNYSKHTNHGFDQMLIVYTVALLWSKEDYLQKAGELSAQRLLDELDFAFTTQGVHKENSPGYQKYMLSRLESLLELKLLGDDQIYVEAEKRIDSAKKYLVAITLPTGELPLIGDTQGGDKGLLGEFKPGIEVLDYTESGYCIVRGLSVDAQPFHLIFKCTHLSDYHRHDDDLSIHLFYGGEVVLGDGGLLNYNEKDEKRKFLRSALAHNTVYPMDGKAIRKRKYLKQQPYLSLIGPYTVYGETSAYGGRLRRTIDFSLIDRGELHISDQMVSSGKEGSKQTVNFFLPCRVKVASRNSSHVVVATKNNVIHLSFNDSPQEIINIVGWASDKPEGAIYSSVYGENCEASRIAMVFTQKTDKPIEHHILISNDVKFARTNGTDSICEKSDIINNKERFNNCLDRKTLHVIKYRDCEPLKLYEKNDWFLDDKYPANFVHHFLSLRWIPKIIDEKVIYQLLKDFVEYHDEGTNKKSRFYEGSAADHTSAIRLNTLITIMNRFSETNNSDIYSLCLKEAKKTFSAMLLGNSYKKANNHGLSVDISLVNALVIPDLKNALGTNIEKLCTRYRKQVESIFDKLGATKEHSISYQEYNLNLLLDLQKAITRVGLKEPWLNAFLFKARTTSKKILGFALKDNGEYHAVGDTFRTPNKEIIKRVFGRYSSVKDTLLPYSTLIGTMIAPVAGFAAIRDMNTHLFFTSAWHSYVHKQDDDLAISVRYKGVDFIEDSGYSDILLTEQIDLKSSSAHSTINCDSFKWLNKGAVNQGRSGFAAFYSDENMWALVGEHTRLEGLTVRRTVIWFKSGDILLLDETSPELHIEHNFILGPLINTKISKNFITLIAGNGTRLPIITDSQGEWINSKREIIYDGVLKEVSCVNFSSNGCATFMLLASGDSGRRYSVIRKAYDTLIIHISDQTIPLLIKFDKIPKKDGVIINEYK